MGLRRLKVGITGEGGFIGNHVRNTLGLHLHEFVHIPFERSFMNSAALLKDFVAKCDVIIHLAGVNRHEDPEILAETNVDMARKLVEALESAKTTPHLIFSSSIQELTENPYGFSKQQCREIFIGWSDRTGGKFSGLIIPNVFGPFGKPFYNSVIATFCHQLTHRETPVINNDSLVQLIYVGDLVNVILEEIREATSQFKRVVLPTKQIRVSEILSLLIDFQHNYFLQGIIPELKSSFELNLFNTFRSYIDHVSFFPVRYVKHTDPRGTFVEIIRLNGGGQFSFSTTLPGVTRGNHFHTRKIERFSVIKGKALIQLRKIGSEDTLDFVLDGDNPSYVDMPIWYTHNIKNIGDEDLYTNFWINEMFNPDNPDTFAADV